MPTETWKAKAEALALAAARRADLDVRDLRLVRDASSVLFELPRAGVIARVERSSDARRAELQVAAARYFEGCGAPVMRLVRPELQPLRFPEGQVTLWAKLEAGRAPLTDTGFGQLIRQLHTCAQDPPEHLPRLTPHTTLIAWQDAPGATIPAADIAEVRNRCSEALSPEAFAALDDPLGTVLLHGDIHGDNIIVTADGPRLIDIELCGVGPASWDLVAMALALRHYGFPEARMDALLRGYGADPRSWSSFPHLVDLYELQVVSWSIMTSARSTAMAEEAQRRVDTFLGRASHRWTLL